MHLLSPILVILSGLALLLTGCTTPPEADDASPEQTPASSSAPRYSGEGILAEGGDLESYYSRQVTWTDCSEVANFECATVLVPLDYEHPEAASIQIAITRPSPADEDTDYLLINPGGPGSSGVSFVQEGLSAATTDDLRRGLTPVGFDPRGVGKSTSIQCLDDAGTDEYRAHNFDLTDPEGRLAAVESVTEYAQACVSHSGDLVHFVDTVSAAKDLEIIRAVLGEDTLDYLGFSYGTKLGAVYADLFPDHVGRFVLDGGLDPALELFEVSLGQAEGFEAMLWNWAQWCVSSDECVLQADSEAHLVADVQDLLEATAEQPMTASDGRPVTANLMMSGIVVTLYSQNTWPILGDAIQDATQDDADVILHLADLVADREPNGRYSSNTQDAFFAINCLDYPVNADPATMEAQAARLAEASPTFGPYMAFGAVSCDAWPASDPDGLIPATAHGAPPILVIGTTQDPATPYEWSESLAQSLQSAVLVTVEGQSHGAYPGGGECVTDIVDDFLLSGSVPEPGLTC